MSPARRPTPARLSRLLDAFPRVRLAVWGDLVLDEFLLGDVRRISREAPVLILEYRSSEAVPGGAANTAANIAALGARVAPIGLVGDDDGGRRLRAILGRAGAEPAGILPLPGFTTPTKTRVLGAGLHTTRQQIVRIDRGRSYEPPVAIARRLAAAALEAASTADGLVVADYGYGTVQAAAARRLTRRLRAAGRLVVVDSRWRLLEFHGATAVTPNEPEVEAALGVSLRDGDAGRLAQAGTALIRRLGLEAAIITRGSRGMAVAARGAADVRLLPVYGADEVADVTGAGDTVTSTLAVALAAGATPLEAATLANMAGGLVVMKQGTATVGLDELREAVERRPPA